MTKIGEGMVSRTYMCDCRAIVGTGEKEEHEKTCPAKKVDLDSPEPTAVGQVRLLHNKATGEYMVQVSKVKRAYRVGGVAVLCWENKHTGPMTNEQFAVDIYEMEIAKQEDVKVKAQKSKERDESWELLKEA